MENEYKDDSFQPEPVNSPEPRGPQFDDSAESSTLYERIKEAKNNGWSMSTRTFISTHRSTLLPLVALVAAVALGLGAIALLNEDQAPIQIATETPRTTETPVSGINQPEEEEKPAESPTIERSKNAVTLQASAGDGITHLARRAIADELSQQNKQLSAEQLVYAEDYLQNRTGDYGLEVGQDVSFSAQDISDAISSAQNLQTWQLENLQQFTQ